MVDSKRSCSPRLGPPPSSADGSDSNTFRSRTLSFSRFSADMTPRTRFHRQGELHTPRLESVSAIGPASGAARDVLGGGAGDSTENGTGSAPGSPTLGAGGATAEPPTSFESAGFIGSIGASGRIPPKGRRQESLAVAMPPKIHCRT